MRRRFAAGLGLGLVLVASPAWAGGEPIEDAADRPETDDVAAPGDEAPSDEAAALADEPVPEDAEALGTQAPPDGTAAQDLEAAPVVSSEPVEEATAPDPEPAPDFTPDAGIAPGGYYRPGEILERSPPDGQRHIVVGSILVPLGTLATVTSAVGAWMTVPDHCAERLPSLGLAVEDPERCRGVFAFNVVRTTYGALMLGSGAVILAIGLVQRQRYRAWRLEHGMRARLGPTLATADGRSAIAGVRVRW